MKIGDVEFHMHFYITDIPYPIVSVGRLLAQNYTATLGKEMLTLHAPDGKNLPVEREGSLFFFEARDSSFCETRLRVGLRRVP